MPGLKNSMLASFYLLKTNKIRNANCLSIAKILYAKLRSRRTFSRPDAINTYKERYYISQNAFKMFFKIVSVLKTNKSNFHWLMSSRSENSVMNGQLVYWKQNFIGIKSHLDDNIVYITFKRSNSIAIGY